MASCSTRQKESRSRDWSEEITVAAFHRQLATVPGNAAIGDLPVDIESSKVTAMLEKHTLVSVHLQVQACQTNSCAGIALLPFQHIFCMRPHLRTVSYLKWKTKHYPHWLSSGKSVALPGMLLQWTPHLDRAVPVVVLTQYAAQTLIESFVRIRNWERCQLQLRTGADKDDFFLEGKTKMSVVTYGRLWKCVTSESADCNRLLKRCKGFLLDEFAIVPPSDKNGGMQLPQQVECAHIISKLVLWNPGTTRLIVTSAALQKEHVRKRFGQEAGFLATSARRFRVAENGCGTNGNEKYAECMCRACCSRIETSGWKCSRLLARVARNSYHSKERIRSDGCITEIQHRDPTQRNVG